MKALIHFWLILSFALLPAQGQGILSLAGSPPAGGGGGFTYLYGPETAEGTGTPSGWSTSGGSPDWDATDQFKNGAQSLKLPTSASGVKSPNTNNPDLYFTFWVRLDDIPAADGSILTLYDTGFTLLFGVQVTSTGALQIVGGSQSAATTAAMLADTWYFISIKRDAGTGANGTGSAAFSTNGTTPISGTQFCSFAGDNGTASVVHHYYGNPNSSAVWFDDISCSDAPLW